MKRAALLLFISVFTTTVMAQLDIVKRKVTLDSLDGRSDTIWTSGNFIPQDSAEWDIGSVEKPYNIIYADSIVANNIDGATYPDSSLLITDSNGKATTDSSKLGVTTNGLAIGNVQNREEAFGSLIITGTTTTSGRTIQSITNNSTGNYPLYLFRKAAGTITAPTAVTGELGRIGFGGYDGAIWWNEGANISVEAPGLWTTTSRPAKINFTTSDYNGVSTNVVAINANRTVSIMGDQADTAYTLSIKGTTRITQTPKIPAGTAGVSLLATDSTMQVQSLYYEQGVYLPVSSGGSNVDAVTPDTAFYTRVGNIVTVSGTVNIDPTTTATPTFFNVDMPVAPINWNVNRAGGTFNAYIVNEGGAIIMDSLTTVLFQYNPTSTGSNIFSYTYSYRIE